MCVFSKQNIFVFTLSILLFFTGCSSAYAQKANQLDEKNIENFIQKTSKIAAGASTDKPEKVERFLNRHLHDDARFKSVMKFTIPGFPTQESAMTLSKEDFIENIHKGQQALSEYENKVAIMSVKISSDKRKATVETTASESGLMDVVNASGDIEQVPVKGASTCQQILMLSKKNYIQMYQANCKTQIYFEEEF